MCFRDVQPCFVLDIFDEGIFLVQDLGVLDAKLNGLTIRLMLDTAYESAFGSSTDVG